MMTSAGGGIDFSFYQKQARGMTMMSLAWSAKDAREAAECAQQMGNEEQAGNYLDQMHVFCAEINRRRKQ